MRETEIRLLATKDLYENSINQHVYVDMENISKPYT